MKRNNTKASQGVVENHDVECVRYNKVISDFGGTDLQFWALLLIIRC